MTKTNKAARRSCNYYRAKGSGRTRSIIADAATMRVAVYTVMFTALMFAIPTLMALLKCWGVW